MGRACDGPVAASTTWFSARRRMNAAIWARVVVLRATLVLDGGWPTVTPLSFIQAMASWNVWSSARR